MNKSQQDQLEATVRDLIASRREGTYWDFKRQWYEKKDKGELLLDIICLANNLESEVAYLIFGVAEVGKNKHQLVGVADDSNRIASNDLIDWLVQLQWHENRWPWVELIPLSIDGFEIDVLVIKQKREELPYLLTREWSGVLPYHLYIRRIDRKMAKAESATLHEAEQLWRRHFGLDIKGTRKLLSMLLDVENWEYPSPYDDEMPYMYYGPDESYTVYDDEIVNEEEESPEFWMLDQDRPSFAWRKSRLMHDGTQLWDCDMVGIGRIRFWTSVPSADSLEWLYDDSSGADAPYAYFEQNTLSWGFHYLFAPRRQSPKKEAHDRTMKYVLVFEDREEHNEFRDYLQSKKDEFLRRESEMALPEIPMVYENVDYAAGKRDLRRALILKEMLEEFRKMEG